MKKLIALLLFLNVYVAFGQTQTTLPAGSLPYGQVYIAPDGTVWTGATGKTFKKIGLAADVTRLNDSITAHRASLNTKVDKVSGKQLSTEDYTTTEKSKLAGIAPGATANQADAHLKARENHTGTQDKNTINGLQAELDSKIPATEKGANNGVATLDGGGKIPNSQIPALALVDTYVVGSQSAMLALTSAEQGDVAIRTDLSKTFILTNNSPGTLGSWNELLSPIIPAETDPTVPAWVMAITNTNITNWNSAYSKRISSAGLSSATLTITLADASTVTASVPTFNQNTTGRAATATLADNSTLWNGKTFGGVGSIFDYLLGYRSDANVAYQLTAANVNTFLGGPFLPAAGGGMSGNIVLNNGVFIQARRNTGNVALNVLGFESGTDDLVMTISDYLRIKNTSNSEVFNILNNGSGKFYGNLEVAGTGGLKLTGGNNIVLMQASSATTGYQYAQFVSSGANMFWGIDNSAGTFLPGNSPYAGFLTTGNARSLSLGSNNTVRYEISSGGNHDFKSGTATFGGPGVFKGFWSSGSGSGTEVQYFSGAGYIQAYNRSSSTFEPIYVRGSSITLSEGHTTLGSGNNLRISTGDIQYLSNAGFGILSADGNRQFTVTNTAIGITNALGIGGALTGTTAAFSGSVTAANLNVSNWNNAYAWGDHNGKYIDKSSIEQINPNDYRASGAYRFAPHANNPTNDYYSIFTYGNGDNVVGQIATHFQTGELFSRGYNTSWTSWKRAWNNSDFTSSNISNWNSAYSWGSHASAGYLTGITYSQVIAALGYTPGNSGEDTYSPTPTDISNISSYGTQVHQYSWIGTQVTVYGSLSVTPDATGSWTIEIDLPAAATFASGTEVQGVITSTDASDSPSIYGYTPNGKVRISGNSGSCTVYYTFRYYADLPV